MVAIQQNVIAVPGQPQKHAEDYTCICTIIGTVQPIFPYKSTVMSNTLTYISTSSLIADCFLNQH